jgi:IS5 family transposase
MAKRERVEPKSREEVVAWLLAHGSMTEDEIAELAAQAAADQTRKLIRKQRAASSTPPAKPTPSKPPRSLKPSVHQPLHVPPPSPPSEQPKARYRIRNWRAYNQALVARGSLTIWLDHDTVQAWENQHKNGKVGRDYTYTDTAIETMLTLKAVFHLPLRATQGLTASILELAQIKLPTPDYSTLSRRARTLEVALRRERTTEPLHVVVDSSGLKVYGEGEWKVRKHGWSKHRRWSKIHIGVDEGTQEVVACVVSEADIADCEALPQVLNEIDQALRHVSTDGGYDTEGCYRAIEERGAQAVIPPRENAVVNAGPEWAGRNATLERIAAIGRAAWKVESGYHRRSLAETAFFRLKVIFGERLSSRTEEGRAVEGRIRCAALNRMTRLGMPQSERVAAA